MSSAARHIVERVQSIMSLVLVANLILAKWGHRKEREHWNLFGAELQKFVNLSHSEIFFRKKGSWLLFVLMKVLKYVILCCVCR